MHRSILLSLISFFAILFFDSSAFAKVYFYATNNSPYDMAIKAFRDSGFEGSDWHIIKSGEQNVNFYTATALNFWTHVTWDIYADTNINHPSTYDENSKTGTVAQVNVTSDSVKIVMTYDNGPKLVFPGAGLHNTKVENQ